MSDEEFVVGQEVECIDHGRHPVYLDHPTAQIPQIGSVYVIRAVNVWPEGTKLRFVGLDNSHLLDDFPGTTVEPGFKADYFRPVVQSNSDSASGDRT